MTPGKIYYSVWNNKGGVGKSFLTFALATEYAKKHPNRQVLVVDMCPQANVSEMLLGGNGAGSEKVAELIDKRKTIGGYFDERIKSPHSLTGSETSYEINVRQFNERIPANLSLVVGDPSLEIQVQTINNIAVQELPGDSWKNVHLWVRTLVDAICSTHEGRGIIVLIDCNPSFSSYTEQAILATNRLIVPCSPDGSSARAISNVLRLVYGIGLPENYRQASFAQKAKDASLPLPKMHLVIFNRYTQYRGTANAHEAMWKQIGMTVKKEIARDRDHRLATGEQDSPLLGYQIPDAHSATIIASWLGMLPTDISAGKQYEIANKKITVSKDVLDRYLEQIDHCTDLLAAN